MRRNRGRDGGQKRKEGEVNEGVGKREEGDKVVGKREKRDGKHTPFSRRTLVISFTNFFQPVSKEKKKKKKKEGMRDGGMRERGRKREER